LKKVQSKKKERAAVEDAIRERKANEKEESKYFAFYATLTKTLLFSTSTPSCT
jgi:hypothetical protein